MARIGRDALLVKNVLAGLLAAGGGAVIYFGYKKWRTRSERADKEGDKPSASQEKTEEAKENEDVRAEDEDVAKSDPTPVLQPEPISPTSQSTSNDPESLSVSGTFEKVSLAAFQERPHEMDDSALHSPSEGFEKVSLPANNSENTDVQSTLSTQSGSDPESTSHPVEEPKSEKPKPSPVPLDTGKVRDQPEKIVTSSIQHVSHPGTTTAGSSLTKTSVSDAKASDPELPSSEPEVQPKDASPSSDLPRGDEDDASDEDEEGNASDDNENNDADEEEGDDDDDDEEESVSDASADSQAKDGVTEELCQQTTAHTTTTAPPIVPKVCKETTGACASRDARSEAIRMNHSSSGGRQAESNQERKSNSLPRDVGAVRVTRTISTASLKDAENVNLALEKLERCLSRASGLTRNSRVLLGHPSEKTKYLDFGLTLRQGKQHIVQSVDTDGLAYESGMRVGDELLAVNNMSVVQWRSDVLLKLLSIINATEFELTISPNDEALRRKGLIRHIAVTLILDKKTVKVNPIVVDKASDYHVAPPIELGAFTPKCCFIEKPETRTFLMLKGSEIAMAEKTEHCGPFEMLRLLFNRLNVKSYQPPVTMLAFCQNDVINYICATARNQLGLMRHEGMNTDIDSLDVADCRFFSHKFVAGFDCFEATQFPDHYLSYEDGRLSLKCINKPKLVGQDRSVQFKLHYTPVK